MPDTLEDLPDDEEQEEVPLELHWLARTENTTVTCNFDGRHNVDTVRELVLIRVVERRDVHGEWSGRLYRNRGKRAVDEQGREFYNSWTSFDDSSLFGPHWWGPPGRWKRVDSRFIKRCHDPDGLLEPYLRLHQEDT